MVGGLCDSDPFVSDGFCYPESREKEANGHRIVAVADGMAILLG